jgi:hypothetical protein
LERFFGCDGGGVVVGDGDCMVDVGICGVGVARGVVDAASSEEDEWCTSAADETPGVADEDVVEAVAVDGLPAGYADSEFGCGASAEAGMGFALAAASTSAFSFSSSDNAAVAALVNSFTSVISPIYNKAKEARNRPIRHLNSKRMRGREGRKSGEGAYIIHEAFAAKDVGEEARGILDARAIFLADHLLPILVIDGA